MVNKKPSSDDISKLALFSIEGQIVVLLLRRDAYATELYKEVMASQPTISKKISELLNKGIIIAEGSEGDRRLVIYSLSPNFRQRIFDEIRKLSE